MAARWWRDPTRHWHPNAIPQVLGMTVARSVIRPPLELTDAPDVVLVDEATMTLLPAAAWAAWLAQRRVVLFGDPRQLPAVLPPVIQWPLPQRPAAHRWILRDVFAAQGVGTPDGPNPAVAALTEQYRMAPAIGELVTWLAYAPALRLIHRTAVDPAPGWGGHPLVWIDTTGHSTPQRTPDRSWQNPGHATVARALIRQLLAGDPEATIAYVAPFRAAAAMVARAWRGEPRVTAATTHRFQGNERTVVIVDLVAPRLVGHPFLDRSDVARRLWNVAVSRAQRQVILLAPDAVPPGTVPGAVITYLRRYGQRIPAAVVLAGADATGGTGRTRMRSHERMGWA